MMPTESYSLAIWDDPALDVLADRIAGAGARLGVRLGRHPRADCERLLRAGMVDAALVPPVSVLSDTEAFVVYSGAAVSAWLAPHAWLYLPDGLERQPTSVACPPDSEQERFMTRIVLQEHYGMLPDLVDASADHDDAAGVLHVDALVADGGLDRGGTGPGLCLDLGQEWYELTNYPMVWGLFVSRAGEADPRMEPMLAEATEPFEVAGDPGTPESGEDSRLRYRLDDLATASLTELADLLFYSRVTDDVPEMPFPPGEPPGEDDGADTDS